MEIYLVVERDYEATEPVKAFADKVEAEDFAAERNRNKPTPYAPNCIVIPIDFVEA